MIMGWRRKNYISLIIFFLFCICFHAAIYTSEVMCMSTLKGDYNYFQNYEWEMSKGMKRSIGGARKLLGRPGSSPPRCTSKCGICTPCQPVHVSVPPGMRVPTEYYPEAWRCKCGNRMYMP